MKKSVAVAMALFVVVGLGGSSFANPVSEKKVSSEGKILAYLDGRPITLSHIKAYVKRLSDPKYKEMLNTPEGLKRLVNYYIDRQILLQEAKKSISPGEGSLRAHSTIDRDSAYIIAYLSKEVGEKVEIREEEVKELARKEGIGKNRAYAELLSHKRRQKFRALMDRLRAKHQIKVLVK